MSKKNNDFFKTKKKWSEIKDRLLGWYLTPYLAKIVHTRRKLNYIDCFAGKGKFDDGNPGSPIIALEIINKTLNTTTSGNPQMNSFFIEAYHFNDLKTNIATYKNALPINGKFEDELLNLLENKQDENVFLYIDPYGIMNLEMGIFDQISEMNFNSVEMLININSFGFFRVACSVLGASCEESEIEDEFEEYEPYSLKSNDQSIKDLTNIAGGEYWKDIIMQYKNKEINSFEAEQLFIDNYCKKLLERFKYVLNIPIRINRSSPPKYRLIHATNNETGCLLMADNIWKRKLELENIQNKGQLILLPETLELRPIDELEIEKLFIQHLQENKTFTSINIILATFFVNNGILCHRNTLDKLLKKFEENGDVGIERDPKFTRKGKVSSFLTESKDQKVYVKWMKQ